MVRTVESIDSRNVDIYMGRWKKYMEDVSMLHSYEFRVTQLEYRMYLWVTESQDSDHTSG